MTALVMLAVGGIPCSILVSPNASLHKWQQAVAPGWLPYMVPQNWIQARTLDKTSQYNSEYVRYVPVVLIEPFTLGTILAFA